MERGFLSVSILDFYLLEGLHVDSSARPFYLDFWNF